MKSAAQDKTALCIIHDIRGTNTKINFTDLNTRVNIVLPQQFHHSLLFGNTMYSKYKAIFEQMRNGYT